MDKRQNSYMPKVSVYIPTKNRSFMLKRSIDSVLKQTYPNIEIVVCDDGSTDSTIEMMKSLCIKYGNILYLREERSKGACHARNKAILAATGRFITGLDDDDQFLPNRIEAFVSAFRPDDTFLCALFYNYNGKRYIPNHYYKRKITKNDILRRNCIGNQIFIKKKDLMDKQILYDEAFPAWQDYEFFTKIVCTIGPGRRVYKRTMIFHTDHNKNRITNPKRILSGYCLYRKKYARFMTPSQRISLAVNAHILQGKKVPQKLIRLCYKYLNIYDLFRIAKAFIKFKLKSS
jgi:glycosyltransferase involved in cell wall biosynthesis